MNVFLITILGDTHHVLHILRFIQKDYSLRLARKAYTKIDMLQNSRYVTSGKAIYPTRAASQQGSQSISQ